MGGLFRGPWRVSTELVEVLGFGIATLGLDLLLRRAGDRPVTRLVSRGWIPETVFVTLLFLMALYVGENDVVPFV